MDDLYPLRMQPVFKDYIWGGSSLKKMFKKNTPYKKTAESWEVAVHKDGCSTVANGEFKGKTIDELIELMGKSLVGELNDNKKFPLMLKLIDAEDSLSVQVHPDDIYAGEHENGELGKTEMWYILDAEPKAKLVYGFKKDITEDEFRKAVETDELSEILNFVDVQPGDVFFIEAGTVHAIGKGLIIAEIQQNSNTTYRVYDWGRVGTDGKPRELHVEKAIDVSGLDSCIGKEKTPPLVIETGEYKRSFLCCCRYFAAETVEVYEEASEDADGRSFHIIMFTDKDGIIEYEGGVIEAQCGESFLIPADMGEYKIKGECKYVKYYVAELEEDILHPLMDAGYIEDEVLALIR